MPNDIDRFKSLAPEHQYRLIKDQLDLGYSAISDRLKILPQISALCATLLVIATFNENLIKITLSTKFLLTILLLLIPTSLYLYISDLYTAEKKSIAYIKKYLDEKKVNKYLGEKNFFQKTVSYFPHIAVTIVFIVVIWICALIWDVSIQTVLSCLVSCQNRSSNVIPTA